MPQPPLVEACSSIEPADVHPRSRWSKPWQAVARRDTADRSPAGMHLRALVHRWWPGLSPALGRAGRQPTGLDLDAVFRCAGTAIAVTDSKLRVLFANTAYGELSGQTEWVGQPLLAAPPAPPQQAPNGQRFAPGGPLQGQVECRRPDGHTQPAWMSLVAICDADGAVRNHVATFTDIGPLVIEREALRRQARHDPLTRLPNRRALAAELARGLARASRHGRGLALLFVDLDHFKWVNDSLGHDAGDQLLRSTALRMQQAVRAGDLVARLGGDEFVVMLEDIGGAPDAAHSAGALLAAIAGAIDIDGHRLNVTASVGIAMFPDDALTAQELVQAADAAMYLAKQQGRNRFAFSRR